MAPSPTAWFRAAQVVVPIAGAVAIVVVLAAGREPPLRSEPGEQPRAVRVLTLEPLDATPIGVGLGAVAPATVWQAVAEVRGRVVFRDPRLEAGAVVPAGTVVLRIEDAEYRLAVARIEADRRAIEAQLAEVDVRESNTRKALSIEAAALAASEAELDRLEALAKSGTVSQSQRDAQVRATLVQRQSVQQQRGALDLVPAERNVLDAQLARLAAELDAARLDIDRTVITVPFDARIAEVNTARDQSVREGEVLVVADGIERAEIVAQVPVSQMRHLAALPRGEVFDPTDPELATRIGLSARVYPVGLDAPWDGRVTRFAPAIHPRTRTVGVVVGVEEPYRRARPGTRPPLVKGMFTRVELSGRTREGVLALPVTAVHENRVYVAGSDERLEIREIRVGLVQPRYVTIASGVEVGERVVLGDLLPAIDGMLLAPEPDLTAIAQLREWVTGKSP